MPVFTPITSYYHHSLSLSPVKNSPLLEDVSFALSATPLPEPNSNNNNNNRLISDQPNGLGLSQTNNKLSLILFLLNLVAKAPGAAGKSLPILKKILQQTDGKDKTLKLIQYACKLSLAFISTATTSSSTSNKTNILVSHLSMTRKIIRLGHFVESLADADFSTPLSVTLKSWTDVLERINGTLGVFNDLADDIYCLSKMGLIQDKVMAARAEDFAAKAWMFSICVDLFSQIRQLSAINHKIRLFSQQLSGEELVVVTHRNHHQQQTVLITEKYNEIAKLQSKKQMVLLSLGKLSADFVFCSYDVFGIKKAPSVATFAGLVSAILGLSKLYVKAL